MSKKSAPAPVPVDTKYIDRLIEALTLLCGGKEPPRSLVHEWETNESEGLQDWAACNTKLPWAMGIGTIEAAQVMADNPEEGQGHELRAEAYPAPHAVVSNTVANELAERISEVFGDDWNLRMSSSGSGDLLVPGGMSYFDSSRGLDIILDDTLVEVDLASMPQ